MLGESSSTINFEKDVLPHLNAAYALARWLTRNQQDAVQDAFLRAFRFSGGLRGGNTRAWLLKIVRNVCYTHLQKNRSQDLATPFDEELHSEQDHSVRPETLLLKMEDRQILMQAVDELPVVMREVLVLRELEGLSYREIAEVANIPLGTVMSTLWRARERIRMLLMNHPNKPSSRRLAPVDTSEQHQDSVASG